MGFIDDNKEIYKERGFNGLLKIYLKLLMYLIINPLIVIFAFIWGYWIISIIWIIPTILGYGIALGGFGFYTWITNKFLKIRQKIYG